MLHTCYKIFYLPHSDKPHDLRSYHYYDLPLGLALRYRPRRFTWAPVGGIFTFQSPAAAWHYLNGHVPFTAAIWRCVGLGPIRVPLLRASRPRRVIPLTVGCAELFWLHSPRLTYNERAYRAVMPLEPIT